MGLEVAGQRLFSTVQSTWNILEPSAGEALREADDAGLHVLLKEVLANGRLAVRPPLEVENLASKHDVGPDAVALAAALSNPWAGTVLIGAVSTAQLQTNLAAADVLLDEGDLEELAKPAVPAERYWAERSALSWT